MDEPALILTPSTAAWRPSTLWCLPTRIILYNTALRILGDEDQAADAVQEAFSCLPRLNSYHGGSFRAWLLRTVTNACYDELRRKKRRPTTPLEPDTADGDEVESPRWLADPHASPKKAWNRPSLNMPFPALPG